MPNENFHPVRDENVGCGRSFCIIMNSQAQDCVLVKQCHSFVPGPSQLVMLPDFIAPLHSTSQAERWRWGSPHLPYNTFTSPLLLEWIAAKQQRHGSTNFLTCLPAGAASAPISEENQTSLCHGVYP